MSMFTKASISSKGQMNELSGCVSDALGLGATLGTPSSVTDVQTFMKPGKECGIKHCIYYKVRVHH